MIRTGKQCIESIRDGREVYINGEQVPEVPPRSRRIMECQ
jgi:aromatic ring hydroxylase